MKRRLIICSSLITLLLSCFSFPIFAEETVQDSSNLHTLSDGVFLDQYFYDNYDPLPYIQSDGTQYINTGVNGSSDLCVDLYFTYYKDISGYDGLFGSRISSNNNALTISAVKNNGQYLMGYYSYNRYFSSNFDPFVYNHAKFDQNMFYLNDDLKYTFEENIFNNNLNMYIFALNNNNYPNDLSEYRLYKLSIYDYSLNDNEGGFVRYYYPAKAKTSGFIGLYDAVNKTFFVSSSNTVFSNPTDEYVENFQISSFLTASLTWIGQIFDAIIQMPIIIVFMAIGLAGAMFRWGRRIVHF